MNKRLLTLLLAIAACSRGGARGGSTDSAAGDVATDPPTRAARLSSIDGTVSLQAPGSDDWTQPAQNYTLSTGDRLYAGQDAHAELDFGNGAVRLDHGGDLTLTNLTDNFTQLGLDQGALEASLYRYDKSDSLEFDTPNGALVPTAPGTYIVSIEPDGGTVVDVESGALEVSGPGLDQTLNAGQVVRLSGTNPIQVVSLDASYPRSQPAFSDLDSWRSRRDPLYTSTGYSSRYVSQSMPGWEDLDDNGVWFADAANARVWCPTRVSKTWVPYREGRWSWVEPWGWTWVDDQPWGYAPFHYGRWETVTHNDCASTWAWVPGPVVEQPVWAPALVAFIDGAALDLSRGPDFEAWFPLGPTAPYFPWYHHSDAYLHDVNVTNLIEVRDVDAIIRDKDVTDHRWVNRDNALTVISSKAFSYGEPVARHAIELHTNLLPPLRIAAHPAVNPQRALLAGGSPAPRPRFAERPRMLVTRGAGGGNARQRSASGAVAPSEPRGPTVNPPAGARERPGAVIERNAPPGHRRTESQVGGEVAPATSAPPRPLIARNAPPPARPSATQRESAMRAHPGRPLGPRQQENLRDGKPAGASHDHEVPAHRLAAPPSPSRPQAQPPQHAQQQQKQHPPQPAARPTPAPAPSPSGHKPAKGKPGRPGGGDEGRGHGD
ncbi:MAG TPA: DUF6600 domain-containing protein [Gemmatimonadaceae bacterium]|jgi:hypothetical protein|nr:DUF6600 domain-containing protein [Gemmatimonadaceae bacterium]